MGINLRVGAANNHSCVANSFLEYQTHDVFPVLSRANCFTSEFLKRDKWPNSRTKSGFQGIPVSTKSTFLEATQSSEDLDALKNKRKTIENSMWIWSGNTTITNRRQPHGTVRKNRSTITRHQEDKLSKATSSLFPIKMIAILEWT